MLRKSASGLHKEFLSATTPPAVLPVRLQDLHFQEVPFEEPLKASKRKKGRGYEDDNGVTPLRAHGPFVHLCPGVTPSSVPPGFMRRSATLSTIVGIQKRFR